MKRKIKFTSFLVCIIAFLVRPKRGWAYGSASLFLRKIEKNNLFLLQSEEKYTIIPWK